MTSGGNSLNGILETTSTGHRRTNNDRLTHLVEMPGVGVFAHLVYVQKVAVQFYFFMF